MNAIDRFLSKISKNSGSDCWQWTASRTQQGYGMFSFQGKSIPAHRFAYEQKVNQDLNTILQEYTQTQKS